MISVYVYAGDDDEPNVLDKFMTAAELAAARQSLGLTPDQLANKLGVSSRSYAEWESGVAPVPARYARDVAYRAVVAERGAALDASGLPECDWVRAWDAAPAPDKAEAKLAHYEALTEHTASCRTCRAREDFVVKRFGPMPKPPVSGGMGVLVRVAELVERLPEWARPSAWGAIGIGGLTMLRMVAALPVVFRRPALLPIFSAVLLGAMAAGAVGGLVYTLIGRPLRKVAGVGPYLAGIVSVAGYMGSIALAAAAVGQPLVKDRGELVVFAVVSSIFGIVLGYSLFRPTGYGSPVTRP